MFTKIAKVRATTLNDLRDHCYSLIPKMQPDVSSYAPGRYRLWLFHEAILGKKQVIPAMFDERLWNFCQRIYPGSNIALLTFNGQTSSVNSDGRIKPHRDDTYAQDLACGVNLGEATFGYNSDRRSNDLRALEKHVLADGDIYRFNCKHLHSVLEAEPNRFSLNIWKIKTDTDKFPGFELDPAIASLLK